MIQNICLEIYLNKSLHSPFALSTSQF